MSGDRPIRFGLVGSGWRAGCYLSTASLLGGRCAVTGVTGRSRARADALAARWGIPAFDGARELVRATSPDFLFVSVKGEATAFVLRGLMDLGLPLLVETPPAQSVEDLESLWLEAEARGARIQVAEQYWLQPLQQARLAAIEAGLIGKPSYVHASVNHNYHNVSLMRKYLGLGFESARIRASVFSAPVTQGPGRGGPPEKEEIKNPEHLVGLLDFGEKGRGLFDFESDQHRSWIRSERLLVRGEKGELCDSRISYLEDFRSPVFDELRRVQTGGDSNFEDYYLKGITLGSAWLYRNPFDPARLSDEEISQAACLAAMEDYVATGAGFYSLAQASQDQYLALMLRKAAVSGEEIVTEERSWARA
jgi:predicted dehydrogenase